MTYSRVVLDHFDRPRNAGAYRGPARAHVPGKAGEQRTGCRVWFDLQVGAGVIERAWFRAHGCPHTIAAASWLTEQIQGQPVGCLEAWNARDLAEELGFPPEKLGRALVIEDALRDCLEYWRRQCPTQEDERSSWPSH